MKARVRFAGKPLPHTPNGTGKDTYEGDLIGNILWVKCTVAPNYPMGLFGVDLTSRTTVAPLEPVAALTRQQEPPKKAA